MLSRWFLIFFTFVLCVTRVVNSENEPGILSTQKGVGDVSNPRPIEDVNNLNALKKQPSKTNETSALPKQNVEPVKEDSGNKIANVKSAGSSEVAQNVSEISQTYTVDTSRHNNESFYSSIKTMREHLSLDNGAVKRTFYVVAGLTGIVLIYFMIKGLTMKRKPRVPRYGLLAEREMEALDDGDDEDEDTTLFDAARYKKKSRGP